jgi:predicted Zn-ribbon and HTH transcriptional regulator
VPNIAETLGSHDPVLTPDVRAALAAARTYDAAVEMLRYHCESCTGRFDESTVEAVLKRAAANTHGEAITPELEAAARMAGVRDEALALLVYHCRSCTGRFDESTVEAVLKRAAANTHGEAITPELEAAVV